MFVFSHRLNTIAQPFFCEKKSAEGQNDNENNDTDRSFTDDEKDKFQRTPESALRALNEHTQSELVERQAESDFLKDPKSNN